MTGIETNIQQLLKRLLQEACNQNITTGNLVGITSIASVSRLARIVFNGPTLGAHNQIKCYYILLWWFVIHHIFHRQFLYIQKRYPFRRRYIFLSVPSIYIYIHKRVTCVFWLAFIIYFILCTHDTRIHSDPFLYTNRYTHLALKNLITVIVTNTRTSYNGTPRPEHLEMGLIRCGANFCKIDNAIHCVLCALFCCLCCCCCCCLWLTTHKHIRSHTEKKNHQQHSQPSIVNKHNKNSLFDKVHRMRSFSESQHQHSPMYTNICIYTAIVWHT